MSVLKIFKNFYIYLKENRNLKEEYWNFEKNSGTVRFGHKAHILELYVSVSEDKRTYFVEEQGSKRITQEEWSWFYNLLKEQEIDSLFIFRNKESLNDFCETISIGSESKKLEELYKCVLEHKDPSYPMKRTSDSLEIKMKNKSYLVDLRFDWNNAGINLSDSRMNKNYYETKEINKYFKRFKNKM